MRKALSKDKEGRYQGIRDLLIDLRELKHEYEFEAKLDRSSELGVRVGATTPERAEGKGHAEAETKSVEAVYTGDALTTPTIPSSGAFFGDIKRHKLGVSLTFAALVIAAVASYFYFHPAPKLTDKDTIVLADFDNKTGDPVFDDTLRQGLSVELQQSPFTLISDRKIQQTLALMGQPKEARLTSEIAQQICERTASAAVLEGSIASVGSHYVLGLRAMNCNTGNILDQEQAVAATREDVLNSLSQIARKFRTRVGESLATVEKYPPLAGATTSSLEALKAYSTGWKVNLSSGNAAAIPFLPARCRNRSEVRDGVRQFGALVQLCWRVRLVGRGHYKSVATAGSCQRSREVFYRLGLRPAGDGKSRKGLPNSRVVASDISSWGAARPRGFNGGHFHPWDRPIRKSDRSRQRKNRGRSRLYLRALQSCHQPSLPGPFRRSRECAATSLRTQAGDLICSSSDTSSRS